MAKLITFQDLPYCPSLSVQIIEDKGLSWLRLSDRNGDNFFGFWSQREGVESEDANAVIKKLSDLLQGMEIDSTRFRDALEFWPRGWDFWPLGVPEPLLDYLTDEFSVDLMNFRKQKKR